MHDFSQINGQYVLVIQQARTYYIFEECDSLFRKNSTPACDETGRVNVVRPGHEIGLVLYGPDGFMKFQGIWFLL